MSIAKSAGKAGVLMLSRKVWGAVVSFAVMAYLARTLSKSDFGIVAISGLLITFVQIFAVSGISEYVIFYKGEDEKKVINAAFWLNLFLSIAITIVVVVLAPLWATYYNDERITNIVYLLAFGFLFNMQAAIPTALFRKELNYKPMILIQTIFGTLGNVGKVVFAFLGFGVYSLALPALIIAPIMSFSFLWASGFRPSKYLNVKYWKTIFDYSKHVIGQRVFGKLINEGDTLFVGRFFGMVQLGVYNLAFQFSNIFVGHVLPILTNISMPVFAKNNQNLPTVRKHLIKLVGLIAFICFPVIGAMIAGAEFLITTIYGDKWIDAVLPFQLLSVFVLFRTLSSPTSGLFNALGKPHIALYFTIGFSVVFLSSIALAGYFFSFIHFVIALVVVRVVGSIILLKLALSQINLSIIDFFKSVRHQFFIFCTSLASAILILKILPGSSFYALLIYITVYILGLILFKVTFTPIFSDLIRMVPNGFWSKYLSRINV